MLPALLPFENFAELVAVTGRIIEKSAALRATGTPEFRAAVKEIVRSVSAASSLEIERHCPSKGTFFSQDARPTHPISTSVGPAVWSQAHTESELELESAVTSEAAALSSAFLQQAHHSLFRRLPVNDPLPAKKLMISAAALRTSDLESDRRRQPPAVSLPFLLARADRSHTDLQGVDAVPYTIASAHFQLHALRPFEAGNGPALRLQTVCALLRISGGLWSINRAFASNIDRYHQLLYTDSAGEASYRARPEEWCQYFLRLCEQEVDFMSTLMDPSQLRERLRSYVMARDITSPQGPCSASILLALQTVAALGTISRDEFFQVTKLDEASCIHVMHRLLDDGLLHATDDGQSVRLGFPASACSVLLPGLIPEHAWEMCRPLPGDSAGKVDVGFPSAWDTLRAR
jgi:Fic family protein